MHTVGYVHTGRVLLKYRKDTRKYNRTQCGNRNINFGNTSNLRLVAEWLPSSQTFTTKCSGRHFNSGAVVTGRKLAVAGVIPGNCAAFLSVFPAATAEHPRHTEWLQQQNCENPEEREKGKHSLARAPRRPPSVLDRCGGFSKKLGKIRRSEKWRALTSVCIKVTAES